MKELYSFLKLSFFTIVVLFSNTLLAQPLEVTDATAPPLTPDALIKNIFLGDGIEVVDVQFEGDPQQVGFFNHGEDEVGIDRGIIMSTGRVATSAVGFGIEEVGSTFATTSIVGSIANPDPDLSAIASSGINDAVKFTIKFRPAADTLRFRYVFASEEYPEWACSSFNDVFGFFISGPGINGPFEFMGENIAIIPGTNLPVAINNIHPQNGNNCDPAFEQYYNDNNGSNMQPVYDGYLDVFTAQQVVIPCEEYTIKLMITDVGDDIFDSGVFLEAKSFGTGTLDVDIATVSIDGSVAEGCTPGELNFRLEFPPEDDLVIDYSIIGTAENGVDYEFIPDDLIFPAGDTVVSVPILAFEDGIPEGLETIGIDVQRDVCTRDTFYIFIRENELLPPELPIDTNMCLGDTIGIDGEVPIDLPLPPTFSNSANLAMNDEGTTISEIVVDSIMPQILGPGVIQSVCFTIQHKWVDDLDIYLVAPGGQFIELTSDNGANCDDYISTCFTPTAGTVINFLPLGFTCGPGENPPFTGDFLPEGVWSDLYGSPTNGTWQLLMIDDSQGFSGTLVEWSITFEPAYKVFYEWTPSNGLSCTDCPNPDMYPDTITTYTLTVSDTYGCEVSDSIEIAAIDVLPAPVISCPTLSNTEITYEWQDVTGATGYLVNVNGMGWVPASDSLSHTITGLSINDTLSIEVQGISNCAGNIGVGTCWTLNCNPPSGMIVTQNNPGCFQGTNGSIEVTGTGGTGTGYEYSLGTETNSTGIFSDLASGVYIVTVTDDFDCAGTVEVELFDPTTIQISEIVVNEISCEEGMDGSVTVTVTGGTAPYSFNWDDFSVDSIYTNLSAGTFNVTVTDANGCQGTGSISLTDPPPIDLDLSSAPATCFGFSDGSATIEPNGGQAPYTYQWDLNANSQITQTAIDLSSGSYFVTVTDDKGCQSIALVAVGQPTELLTTIDGTNLDCNNDASGTVSVSPSGGLPGYSFEWNNMSMDPDQTGLDAGVYSVTVSDINNCTAENSIEITEPDALEIISNTTDVGCFGEAEGNWAVIVSGGVVATDYFFDWSNGQQGMGLAAINNLVADDYCVTVTDDNGCTITLCETISEPAELVLTTDPQNAGCNGGNDGSIDLTIQGGTMPFDIIWDNGEITEDLADLIAGSYEVTVTDANNCIRTTNVIITEISAIVLSTDFEDVNCNGGSDGSIDLTAIGGSGTLSYNWQGPGGFVSNLEDPSNIQAGDYFVTVSDTEGCSETTTVTISQPLLPVSGVIDPISTLCNQASDGSLMVMPGGGVPPYTYNWSNGQTGQTINNLTAGTYSVTITDSNDCEGFQTMQIDEQEALSVSLTQQGASCFNGSDGSASISGILYGNNPANINDFDIQWSNSQTTSTVNNLLGGVNYSVVVTDILGCTATNSITIGNPSEIGGQIVDTQDVSCFGGSDGFATVTGSGGTEPYSYFWSVNAGNQTTATADNLAAQSFTVTITDDAGCFTSVQVNLSEPTELEVDFSNIDVPCWGQSTGSSMAMVEGGNPPYTLTWENGQNGSNISDLAAGYVNLTVVDDRGCQIVDSTLIRQPETPLETNFDVTDVTCHGFKDGTITLFVDGGTEPYSFSLDGIDYKGSASILALESGFYNVYIKDGNDCIFESGEIFISEPDPIFVEIGPDTTINFGETLQLFPEIQNANLNELSFFWWANHSEAMIDDSVSMNPTVSIDGQTTFYLNINDENGCRAEDLITVFIRKERSVVVPTGFTPNSDGANDRLIVHGKSDMVTEVKLFQVFDRWGELIYQRENFNINDGNGGWDGTFKGEEMNAGVYVWNLVVQYVDGIEEALQGQTTLIR